ncbi:MAG: phosphopantothenoylcysteine decarboxylase, partial [Candidatus Eiseniibacteriota bacterium]
PQGVKLERVHTAAEMERAVLAAATRADLVLMAAAVSDYRPIRARKEKIKREAATLALELAPNPDILARAASRRRRGQIFVGFALETSQGLKHAREKLVRKNLDLVVLNTAADSLGRATNRVTLVGRRGVEKLPVQMKRDVAEAILDRASQLRRGGAGKASAKAARSRAGRKAARKLR